MQKKNKTGPISNFHRNSYASRKKTKYIALIFIIKLLLFKRFLCRFLHIRSEFLRYILINYLYWARVVERFYIMEKCAISVMSIVTIKKRYWLQQWICYYVERKKRNENVLVQWTNVPVNKYHDHAVRYLLFF